MHRLDLLKKLKADMTFRPDEGTFRSKMVDVVLENADEEYADLFSEPNCDIQVSISARTLEEGTIIFLVESDMGNQTFECNISALSDKEFLDLEGQLAKLNIVKSSPEAPPKVIVRKGISGMLNAYHARQMLGCSEAFLMGTIPCTDYSWSEVNGKKEIRDYFWSKTLIERLCNIKLSGATPENLNYVAVECCDGDCKWAEEILVSLGLPTSPAVGSVLLPKETPKKATSPKLKGAGSFKYKRKRDK